MSLVHDLEGLNSDFTPQVIAGIDEIIEKNMNKAGSLIPVLTGCQEIVGYLPIELQEYIGKQLQLPGSDIYGVVTFYSFFTMVPKGRYIIKVCMGTGCYVRGAPRIIDELESELSIKTGETTPDLEYTLETVACFGSCALAPVVVFNDKVYGRMTPDKIKEMLKKKG